MELALTSLAECEIENDSDCVTLLLHVLDGLDFLHGHNIMHRDIKPANILLTNENPPKWKLSDFGLCKEDVELAMTFCGSPMYLAPEVDDLDFSLYSNAVDIWSVGVVGVEYSYGFDLNTMRLLKSMTDRKAWCIAVSERSEASRLAPYLTAMLDMVASRRPSAGEMRGRLQSWRSDELEETSTIPPQDNASQRANVRTASTLSVGKSLGLSRKRALSHTD
jgi:serine/threonine protein kinase